MMSARRRCIALLPGVLTILVFAAAVTAADGQAEALSASFRKAAKRVLPAVVTVRTGTARGALGRGGIGAAADFPLGAGIMPEEGGASGVVIDAGKGLVLTNDHVVQAASRIIVVLHDGSERDVTQVRRDPKSDLALLSIDPKGLSQAEWGDSDGLDTGDWVLAIGQSFGLSGTVTAGIVSGKGRGLGSAMYDDFLQTDAAINPGNSGGPLINLNGEVVGINTAIKTLAGGSDGVGFAIPSARARRVAADLAALGRVRRAYLGVQVGPVDRATAERLREPGAVVINGVAAGTPADEAGLRVGDVLLRLGDQPLRGPGALQSAIEIAKVGAPLALTVDRNGERREFNVTPREQPEAFGMTPAGTQVPLVPRAGRDLLREPLRAVPPEILGPPAGDLPAVNAFPEIGVHVAEQVRVLPARPAAPGERPGLLITAVDPGSPADVNGLEAGMVITDVGKQRVATIEELRSALAKRPKERDLVVRVLRGAKPEFRVLLDLDSAPRGEEKRDDPDANPATDAPKTR